MSRILVDQIRSNSASADALTLDGSGNLTIPGNLTCSGNASLSGTPTGFGGGKVLQVVNNYGNTNVTTSGNTVSDLLTTAITPASTSNKILCMITANLWVSNGGITSFGGLRLYRGANSSGTQIYDLEVGLNTDKTHWAPFYFTYLDSPNTSSAQSYTMSIRRYSSHTTSVATDGKTYQMTLMEIAA